MIIYLTISLIIIIGIFIYMAIEMRQLKKRLSEYVYIEKELQHCNEYDLLSGLKNRNSFILQSQKEQADIITVLVCDIDVLKIINDISGHQAGDSVIRKTGLILRQTCPINSHIFRMGGDEFLALIYRGKDLKEDSKIKKTIKQLVDEHNQELDNVPLSLSIGLTTSEFKGEALSDVINRADMNMYQQKRAFQKHRKVELENALRNKI